ncbi:MAG: hypothetical protein EAS48_02240 [Chryseobacterium sp.]|nr:MAG: hypothetical protein EAS48_02240 [Chryseobacterium sp.]
MVKFRNISFGRGFWLFTFKNKGGIFYKFLLPLRDLIGVKFILQGKLLQGFLFLSGLQVLPWL